MDKTLFVRCIHSLGARVLQRKSFRRYEQDCRGQVAVPLSGM